MKKAHFEVFDLKAELAIEKMATIKEVISKLWSLLLVQKTKVIFILMILILKIILIVSTPLAISKIIDLIVEGVIKPLFYDNTSVSVDYSKLVSIILALIGKKMVSLCLGDIQKQAVKEVISKIIMSIKGEIKDKLASIHCKSRVKWSEVEKETFQSALTENLKNVEQGLKKGAMNVLTSILTAIGALMVMFKMDGLIAIMVVISFAIALGALASLNLNVTRGLMMANLMILALGYKRLSVGQMQGFIHYVKQLSKPFDTKRLTSFWKAISSRGMPLDC